MEFLDANQIDKISIKRGDGVKVGFSKLENDIWEVSFFSEQSVCPVYSISVKCKDCVFNDEDGCSAVFMRVNTEAVIKLCFGIEIKGGKNDFTEENR